MTSFRITEIAIFIFLIFCVYWFFNFKRRIIQNIILLLASYVFYGILDLKFLIILLGISLLSFIYGLHYEKNKEKGKRVIFWTTTFLITISLVYFKYFNFFITETVKLGELIGVNINLTTASIILPIGISF